MRMCLFFRVVRRIGSASEVKLTLMDKYPDDYEVTIVTAAGLATESLTNVPTIRIGPSDEVR